MRQLVLFGVVGGLQLLLDWGLFVALTALGAPVAPANVAARVAGAMLGFWMNGRVTFVRPGQPALVGRPLARFVAFWLATTAVSTLGVYWLDDQQGRAAAWLGKPLLDAGLAVLGFFAGRHWIYR